MSGRCVGSGRFCPLTLSSDFFGVSTESDLSKGVSGQGKRKSRYRGVIHFVVRSLGLTTGSSPSVSSTKVIAVNTMSSPGGSTHHQ